MSVNFQDLTPLNAEANKINILSPESISAGER
jgi:hypothetical protein